MTEQASRSPGETLVGGTSQPAHRNEQDAARIEMRNAVQWLARVTRSYSGASDDALHLYFDPAARHLHTPDVAPGTQLALYLPGLVFQFHEHGTATPHALDVDDRSSTEVEAWLLAELLHRGFDRDRFRKELPYAWPSPMAGDAIKYGPHGLSEELARHTQELVEAATFLNDVRKATDHDSARISDDLVYWPSRHALGFRLPLERGVVEVDYEPGDGPEKPFRVSLRPTGRLNEIDVLVSRSSHMDTRLADRLLHAIERAGQDRGLE